MEIEESTQTQFEFLSRRVVTEGNRQRTAAGWYNSKESNDEEELTLSEDYFDLNMLPDTKPQDLLSNQ